MLDSITREDRFFIAKELCRALRREGLAFIYEPSINDGYYKQFVKSTNDLSFVCPDDDIKREIFTRKSITEPFQKLFEIKRVEEMHYKGKMFWKEYERAWWFVVLKNKKIK